MDGLFRWGKGDLEFMPMYKMEFLGGTKLIFGRFRRTGVASFVDGGGAQRLSGCLLSVYVLGM